MITRELPTTTKIADDKSGIVEYVASDQSMDSQGEVIRADGWRFDRFAKNAPLVDSHKYNSIGCVLGKVLSFTVQGRQLVETVQWAIDVPENQLARLGYQMTKAGYLKAVSVGFAPERVLTVLPESQWSPDWAGAQVIPGNSRSGKAAWANQMTDLGCAAGQQPHSIYLAQQQLELSVCVIGANPNALARSYKDGLLSDADLELISTKRAETESARRALDAAAARQARQRRQAAFLEVLQRAIEAL